MSTVPRQQTGRRGLIDRFSVLVVGIAALLWASDVFFRVTLLAHGVTASEVVFAEDALITLAFLPVLPRAVREVRRLHRRAWLAIGLIAVGPQAIATVLFTQSVKISISSNAFNETYLVQQVQPLIAVGLAWLLLHERRRPSFWPLAAVVLVAEYFAVFAVDPGQPWSDLQHGRVTAALFALGAAALWASGTVLGRWLLDEMSFVSTTALRFTLALPVLLAILIIENGASGFGAYHVADLPNFVGIALIPGFIALLLYYRALRSTPASLATLAETTYPVVVTLLLALPKPYGFSQPVLPLQLAATAVLVLAVVALNFLKARDVVREPRPHELQLAPRELNPGEAVATAAPQLAPR